MRVVPRGLALAVALLGALFMVPAPARSLTLFECNGPVSSFVVGSSTVVNENQRVRPLLAVHCLRADQTVSVSDIDWGDGTIGPALVTYLGGSQDNGSALIDGVHSYPRATCPRGFCSNFFSVTATATVDQTGEVIPLREDVLVAPVLDVVSLSAPRLRAHELFRARVAAVHTGGTRFLREMSARIDWGDGRTSHATVGGFGRDFEVYGHHHWRFPGVYNVKVQIRDGFTGEWILRYLRARVTAAQR